MKSRGVRIKCRKEKLALHEKVENGQMRLKTTVKMKEKKEKRTRCKGQVECICDPGGWKPFSRTLNHPNVHGGGKGKAGRPLYFIHVSFHPVVTNCGDIFLRLVVAVVVAIISRYCFLDLS